MVSTVSLIAHCWLPRQDRSYETIAKDGGEILPTSVSFWQDKQGMLEFYYIPYIDTVRSER
jgi:hypothetical protein